MSRTFTAVWKDAAELSDEDRAALAGLLLGSFTWWWLPNRSLVLAFFAAASGFGWILLTGVIIGFESDDDWFDYRLEHHPEFLRRIAASRMALEQGRGIRLEDLGDVALTSRWSGRRR